MSYNHDETKDYDLSTTGTIVEIESGADEFGLYLSPAASADYVLEAEGHDVGPIQLESFSAITSGIDKTYSYPAGITFRLRNTTTASDTADSILSGTNPE